MNRFVIVIAAAIILVLGIASFAYAVQKCGLGTSLLLGKGAFTAAVLGMCDY
jgi:hypothetical protein